MRAAKKSVVSATVHIEMKDGCPYSNWNLKLRDCKKEGSNPVALCLLWLWVLWIRNCKFCICLPYALACWIWKRPHVLYFCIFGIWMKDIKIFYQNAAYYTLNFVCDQHCISCIRNLSFGDTISFCKKDCGARKIIRFL